MWFKSSICAHLRHLSEKSIAKKAKETQGPQRIFYRRNSQITDTCITAVGNDAGKKEDGKVSASLIGCILPCLQAGALGAEIFRLPQLTKMAAKAPRASGRQSLGDVHCITVVHFCDFLCDL